MKTRIHLQDTALAIVTIALMATMTAGARADEVVRLSNDPNGQPGNGASYGATISADGSTVVFSSAAKDLVDNDNTALQDVFALDRATGVIELISVSLSGSSGNSDSFGGVPSADGRYVAFRSKATNLISNGQPQMVRIYLRDRVAQTTVQVSVASDGTAANGESDVPSISDDGRYVAFMSMADNLVAGDTNRIWDIFVRDVQNGTTSRVSVTADGSQGDRAAMFPYISGDGSTVVFYSEAKNLPGWCDDPDWGIGEAGIYAKDLASGAVERVDVDSTGNAPFCDNGQVPCGVTVDGNQVLFMTPGELDPTDANGYSDVYVRDRAAGTTERISYGSLGAEPTASISRDGIFVVFTSRKEVVDPPDDDLLLYDVFLFDRTTSLLRRVSIGGHDEQPDGNSGITNNASGCCISDDDLQIVFTSSADNISSGDDNAESDVFVRVRPGIAPSWTNYGAGFPGRGGVVPTIVSSDVPRRGTTIDIDLSNSSNLYEVAFLLVGLQRESITTNLGGTLLVDFYGNVPLPMIPSGVTFTAYVPNAWWTSGLTVDLQALELDPFAARGVSFTDGLELVMGD